MFAYCSFTTTLGLCCCCIVVVVVVAAAAAAAAVKFMSGRDVSRIPRALASGCRVFFLSNGYSSFNQPAKLQPSCGLASVHRRRCCC